jgi:hypothetical protein
MKKNARELLEILETPCHAFGKVKQGGAAIPATEKPATDSEQVYRDYSSEISEIADEIWLASRQKQ